MRQALMMGARPLFSRGKRFPEIPLGAGNWTIQLENFVDSKVNLLIKSPVTRPNGVYQVPKSVELTAKSEPLIIVGPVVISTEITEAGNEHSVNIIAVVPNGS